MPKRKYLTWPENDEPLEFDAITDPIIKAIRYAYKMERRNGGKDIPWTGPNIGKDSAHVCLGPFEALNAARLAYNEEDQGRDALKVIIGLAMQIGIEQGRRITMNSSEIRGMRVNEILHRMLIDQKLAEKDAESNA
jgi:hypothetical protein